MRAASAAVRSGARRRAPRGRCRAPSRAFGELATARFQRGARASCSACGPAMLAPRASRARSCASAAVWRSCSHSTSIRPAGQSADSSLPAGSASGRKLGDAAMRQIQHALGILALLFGARDVLAHWAVAAQRSRSASASIRRAGSGLLARQAPCPASPERTIRTQPGPSHSPARSPRPRARPVRGSMAMPSPSDSAVRIASSQRSAAAGPARGRRRSGRGRCRAVRRWGRRPGKFRRPQQPARRIHQRRLDEAQHGFHRGFSPDRPSALRPGARRDPALRGQPRLRCTLFWPSAACRASSDARRPRAASPSLRASKARSQPALLFLQAGNALLALVECVAQRVEAGALQVVVEARRPAPAERARSR